MNRFKLPSVSPHAKVKSVFPLAATANSIAIQRNFNVCFFFSFVLRFCVDFKWIYCFQWWCSRGHVIYSLVRARTASSSKQRTERYKVRINRCERTTGANKEFYFRLNTIFLSLCIISLSPELLLFSDDVNIYYLSVLSDAVRIIIFRNSWREHKMQPSIEMSRWIYRAYVSFRCFDIFEW